MYTFSQYRNKWPSVKMKGTHFIMEKGNTFFHNVDLIATKYQWGQELKRMFRKGLSICVLLRILDCFHHYNPGTSAYQYWPNSLLALVLFMQMEANRITTAFHRCEGEIRPIFLNGEGMLEISIKHRKLKVFSLTLSTSLVILASSWGMDSKLIQLLSHSSSSFIFFTSFTRLLYFSFPPGWWMGSFLAPFHFIAP